MNGLSTYAALKFSSELEGANIRIVALMLGFIVLIGTILYTFVFYRSDGFAALIIPIVAAPAFYIIYIAWRDEEI